MEWHLAQVNIGRLRARVDDPLIVDFAAALDRINALADAAPGFIWRLQTEDGNATAIRAFEWDTGDSAGVLVNMVKHSAIVSVIAVFDLTTQARTMVSDTFMAFEIWLTAAVMYLAVTISLSLGVRWLERRYRRR